MEAMNLVEVVLHNDHDGDDEVEMPDDDDDRQHADITTPLGLKNLGLDHESITITLANSSNNKSARTSTGLTPAAFEMFSRSNPRKVANSSGSLNAAFAREEMVCKACDRVFKYKAAFVRHEAQCGHPSQRHHVVQKPERPIEPKKVIKIAPTPVEKPKEEEKMPEFRCTSCLRQFHDKFSFNSHDFNGCAAERATYTFVCTVCQARFKYKNHLRRHEDSHNNVRRYECEVCTTAFLRPDHLKRHMMRMHGIVRAPTQSAPETTKMKATEEPLSLLRPSDPLTRRVTKNVPIQCPMCNKVLSRRDHVLRHMRNVHQVKPFKRSRARIDNIPSIDSLLALGNNLQFGSDVSVFHRRLADLATEEEEEEEQDSGRDPLADDEEDSYSSFHEGEKQDIPSQTLKKEVDSSCDNEKTGINGKKPNVKGKNTNDGPHSPGKKDKGKNSIHDAGIKKGVKAEKEAPGLSLKTNGKVQDNKPSTNGDFGDAKKGNQNVVSNGMSSRAGGSGGVWISDLAKHKNW